MPFPEFSLLQIALITLAFFLGGAVKGTVGVGMKIVVLGVLAAFIHLPVAIALMVVPSVITNIWQIFSEKGVGTVLRRIWPLLAMLCIGAWFGTAILAGADTRYLTALLGLLLCLYAAYGLYTPRLHSPGRHEPWLTPAVGTVNGLLTGMTGIDMMPGVPYMAALGFTRDQMMQGMGLLFLVASVAVGVGLGGHGLMDLGLGVASTLATLPAVAGFMAGAAVRRHLSDDRFRQILLVAIFVLGLYILVRSLT